MNTVRHALVYTKCTRIEWDSFRDFTQMIEASLRFPPQPPFLLPVSGSPMAFPVAGGEGFAPIQMIFSLVLVFFLSLFPFSPFSFLLPRRKVSVFLPPSSISATPLLAGQHLSSPTSHLPLRPPRKWSWFEGFRYEDQKSWGRDRSSVSTSPSPVEIDYEVASDGIFGSGASGEEEFVLYLLLLQGSIVLVWVSPSRWVMVVLAVVGVRCVASRRLAFGLWDSRVKIWKSKPPIWLLYSFLLRMVTMYWALSINEVSNILKKKKKSVQMCEIPRWVPHPHYPVGRSTIGVHQMV